jgi:hypothetical protein
LLDLLTFPAESDRHKLIDATRTMRANAMRRVLREVAAESVNRQK